MSAGGAGRVVLVGAGPGDPGLLTVRGAEVLRSADAVVHDALVPAEMLALAPERAERFDVGKRGHDEGSVPQQEINALLVRLAREGKAVVRLKGGDPFVFGRGGEEASACVEAGVAFEVVPGVTAAVAAPACAGIPITDRRFAASFTVVTGHRDPGEPAMRLRWGELARSGDTLVILMGMTNLGAIAGRLIEAGRDAATPCAAIEWGGTPRQRVVEAPLAGIAEAVTTAALGTPTTIVVGDVVRLRTSLAWFERRPLFGRRVLVTRSEEQAGELVQALASAGARAVVLPMIRIAPLPADPALREVAADLAKFDLVVFTSANAVRHFVRALAEAGASAGALRARVVCVGPATARAAAEVGLAGVTMPGRRFDAEGVLDLLRETTTLAGLRVLLPRAASAREVLPQGLREAGAEVTAVAVYRTAAATLDLVDLRRRLLQREFDALTFTSPSTVRHFFEALDEAAREATRNSVVAAIGAVTAGALRAAGRPADVVAEQASARSLVLALERRMAAGEGGG